MSILVIGAAKGHGELELVEEAIVVVGVGMVLLALREELVVEGHALQDLAEADDIFVIVVLLYFELLQVFDDEVLVDRVMSEHSVVILEPIVTVRKEYLAFNLLQLVHRVSLHPDLVVRHLILIVQVLQEFAKFEVGFVNREQCLITLKHVAQIEDSLPSLTVFCVALIRLGLSICYFVLVALSLVIIDDHEL